MSVAAVVSRAAWLADDTDVGDETHKAGPLAILIIAVLCVACFLLFRSMSKHMRRVREQFPADSLETPESMIPRPSGEGTDHDRAAAAGVTTPSGTSARGSTPKSRPRAADEPSSR